MNTKQCKLCSRDFDTAHGRQVYCNDCLTFPETGKVAVYGLQDRRGGGIRYIGSTDNPVNRFMGHRANRDAKSNPALSDWRKAVGDNLQMVILKVVSKSEARRWEEAAIRRYSNLLNGRAASEKVYTPEQAHRILAKWLK